MKSIFLTAHYAKIKTITKAYAPLFRKYLLHFASVFGVRPKIWLSEGKVPSIENKMCIFGAMDLGFWIKRLSEQWCGPI